MRIGRYKRRGKAARGRRLAAAGLSIAVLGSGLLPSTALANEPSSPQEPRSSGAESPAPGAETSTPREPNPGSSAPPAPTSKPVPPTGAPPRAEPATVRVAISTTSTGTAPFDGSAGPGMDTGPDNSVVRTMDSIVYKVDFSSIGDAKNSRVRLKLSHPDAKWKSVPAECGPGSSISGAVLNCVLGDKVDTSQAFVVTARIPGGIPDGTQLTVEATAEAANAAGATATTAPATVTAAPRWDLRKNFGTVTKDPVPDYEGMAGYRVRFPVVIGSDARKRGSEALRSPLTFTDDLSQLFSNSKQPGPRTKLMGCGPNGADGRLLGTIPLGSTASGAADAAADSGTWRCTRDGAKINVSIANADTSLNHVPTRSQAGATLPGDYFIAVSGVIDVFVAKEDLDEIAGDASVKIRNFITGFAPVSTSGQSNYGEGGHEPGFDGSDNNLVETYLDNTGSGSFAKRYADIPTVSGKDWRIAPDGQRIGDHGGIVTPEQEFGSFVAAKNEGLTTWKNTILCDVLDSPRNVVTGKNGLNRPATTPRKFQYAAGPAWPDPRAQASAGCFDSDGPWFDSLDEVPGGASAVKKVRAVVPEIAPGETLYAWFGLKAAAGVPNGTKLRNFGWVQSAGLRGGAPVTSGGDPEAADGTLADHILVVDVRVRVRKATLADGDDPGKPSDKTDSVPAGRNVRYSLLPFVISAGSSGGDVDVTVVDTLPPGLTYLPGTASAQPASVADGPDGTTVLAWNLGKVKRNAPIAPITYTAHAGETVANGVQLTNSVEARSPADASPVEKRTATRGVTVTNATGFSVGKTAPNAVVYPGQGLRYSIDVGNVSGRAAAGMDLIDVLPWKGDKRKPATAFAGTATLKNVDPDYPGATVRFTKTAPGAIDADPGDRSNHGDGATKWCASTEFGSKGCPASMAEATAFRVTDQDSFASGAKRRVAVRLDAKDNAAGDVYTNRASVRSSQLVFAAQSGDAAIRVVEPSLSLVKEVCASGTPADCAAGDDAKWVKEQEIPRGSTATWRIRVTNTSGVSVGGVRIRDVLTAAGGGTEQQGFARKEPLQPGETWTHVFRTGNVTAGIVNKASAEGKGEQLAGFAPAVHSAEDQAGVSVPEQPVPPTTTGPPTTTAPPAPPTRPGPPGGDSGTSAEASKTGSLALTGSAALDLLLAGLAAVAAGTAAVIASRRRRSRR